MLDNIVCLWILHMLLAFAGNSLPLKPLPPIVGLVPSLSVQCALNPSRAAAALLQTGEQAVVGTENEGTLHSWHWWNCPKPVVSTRASRHRKGFKGGTSAAEVRWQVTVTPWFGKESHRGWVFYSLHKIISNLKIIITLFSLNSCNDLH